MKILSLITLCLSLFLVTSNIQSQEINIPGSIYNEAQEPESKRNSFNRERWFYEQRMYPYDYIPEDAYGKAYDQKMQMRNTQGFYRDNMSWVNVGPTSGYYFNYGYISSRIVTMAIHPFDFEVLYIGAANGGVWKSTNDGVTWEPKSDFEVSLSSGSIVIDPNNPNIIYYGTGEATYSGASYYGRGLLKSTDGGETWTNYVSGLPFSSYTSRLVIRPGHSNQLLAAMGNAGLFRSTDGGMTWNSIYTSRYDDVIFSPTGDTAYASGSNGIRISTDGGVTFPIQATGYQNATRNHIAQCKSAPNVVYAAGYYASNPDATKVLVFKSTNYGFSFTQVAAGTNFVGTQAWYDFYMHVNPHDPNYAYVGSIDIWRTTNGGTSFQNITNGYSGGNVHVDQHNMVFHPVDPDIVYALNDGGINFSSNRGTTWTNLNEGLTLTQFYRIASNPSNPDHIFGGTQDNGTQRTFGSIDWIAAFGGDGGEVVYHAVNNQYMLGETQNNGVRRSSNAGQSWVTATTGLSGSGSWVAPLITHPDSAGIFYTARGQVFKTTNWGQNWFGISSGSSGTIREMNISKSNPEIMYASSGSNLFKSTNRGYSFVNVSSGAGLPARTITSINIHPDSSDVAIITFSGFNTQKIYKTTDQGATWFGIFGNLPDSPVNDALIYYPGYSTSTYIAANDVGVFISDDWGTTWRELANGLPNTVAMSMDYHETTGKLRIGTHGRGVWETTIVTTISNVSNEIVERFELLQNYPNPFNPSTVISFRIPSQQNVKLSVYNSLGKEIAVLVNSKLSQGKYDVNFDMSGYASGLYFYKLETENFVDTKKMLYVK